MFWRQLLLALFVIFCALLSHAQLIGQSLPEIKVAAEAGDPIAQCKLAAHFVQRLDSRQAELWYRKSASQGYKQAQGQLGNILLLRTRTATGASAKDKTTMAEEAIKWMTLAANQGDRRGQADLADVLLEGKLVKQDLIEACKWGELASRGSIFETSTFSGRSTCDAAILIMSPEQIAEAKRRVSKFVPGKPGTGVFPEPAWLQTIKLSGLSGPANRRLALINGVTFAEGEVSNVKLPEKTVRVRCTKITDRSAMVEIEGIGLRELKLQD